MKLMQKTACLLTAAMVVASLGVAPSADAAAKAPKLSDAKKTVSPGKSFTLKIKKKGIKIVKTTWKVSKKKVATISKPSKTSVKVKAKKAGSATVTASVKYKAGSKSASKKLTCKVTVKKPAAAAPTPVPQQNAPNNQTGQNGGATPTPVPTPTPTPKPYYYEYEYFAMYDCSKADKPDNFFVNFVLSDSWSVNTKLSAIESLDFVLDSTQACDIDVYVAEYDCDMATAKKITTISANGSKGQQISLTSEIKGNADIAALDSTNNGMISFGFAVPGGQGQIVLHDMYVNYTNNNTQQVSHHKAAISVVTSALGSVKTQYNNDKNAADAADQDFSATIDEYMARKPAGMFEARPKDASDAISNYDSLAKITESKGYKFGTCVTYEQIKNDPEFCKLLAHHCDSITAMNEFKAYSLLDEDATLAAYKDDNTSMPVMKYDKADFLCEWARDNGLKIRGHALVWDNAMEEHHRWFFTKGYQQDGDYASNDICRARLKYYVDQVMRHFQEKYPDVVYCWDVVNEGIDEGSSDRLKIRQNRMGQNPFYYHCSSEANGQGENYIKFTFDCAYDTRQALINEGKLSSKDKIELVYNDFNIIDIYSEEKQGYVKNLVTELNSDPARQLVDTVGCQGYLGGYQHQEGCLDPQWVTRTTDTIKSFSQMQPSVHVQLTEMAMRNFDYDYMGEHGNFAADLFNGLANINSETGNAFTSMSIWAFIDDPVMNKVEESFDYWQYGPFSGMFDDVYRVKPAFKNAYDILSK